MENLQVINVGDYAIDLFKCLKLQIHEQIVFLVALSHTTNPTYRQDAIRVLKAKLKEYYSAGKPQPLAPYAAHRLLMMLLSSPDFVIPLLLFSVDHNFSPPSRLMIHCISGT